MSEILKKLDQVQEEKPQPASQPATGEAGAQATRAAAPQAHVQQPAAVQPSSTTPALQPAAAARSKVAGAVSSFRSRLSILGNQKSVKDVRFRSRQLAGRFMSAVRRKMGGAAKKPAKLKTLLLGSFGAGFALILLIVFFLPSASKTRSASRTRTTVQAPLRRAAPNPAASGVAGVAARAPAMASSRGAVASSTAPSEKELALIASMEQLAKSGKIDQAITQLERETGANPFLARALFTLATLYQKKNLLDKATATLMRVLQVEPKNPLAYNNLGLIQLRLKRFNEAVVFLEKACENAQGTPEPWLNMGIAYEQKLRWSDSVRAYERYVRLMSTDHAKTIRSVNDEKIISAVNIRLLRLRAFSAADDRKIASIGEDGEDDEDEQKENEPEDPRTAAETQLKAGESEIDPIPIVQKMTGGRAKLAAPPESAKPEKSRSPAGAPFEPSPGASP